MIPLRKAPGDWVGHAYTARLRDHLAKQELLAMEALLSVARVSPDPHVRHKYAELDYLRSFQLELEKVTANGSDDE